MEFGLKKDYNTTSERDIVKPFKLPFLYTEVIAPTILLWIFFIVGTLLNLITILVIFANPKLKNVFTIIILSLCFSDLISALISPLFWYRRTWGFKDWIIPDFFCKLYWATDLMTSYATALHVAAFAVLRYISIKYPHKFKKITIRRTKIIVLIIWLVCAFDGFVPFSIFFGSSQRDRTKNNPTSRWPSCTLHYEWLKTYVLYARIAYPLCLCLPIITVFVISIVIAITVRYNIKAPANSASQKKRRGKENQAFVQLILIVFSFIMAYVPFIIYELWSSTDLPQTEYYTKADYWFGMSEYISLRFFECLNPVFYNLGSTKMRKCTRKYLTNKLYCFRTVFSCNTPATSKGHSASITSSITMNTFGV